MCLYVTENILCSLLYLVNTINVIDYMIRENVCCCYRQRQWVYIPEHES